ncbi:ADP-ribosylation factor-like protein 6-interacting protein 1 [Armadillidium vulgare]|nr:ADP-ribosylation factor-like protein 6-interacting protein 1 [Armadillidium vulgare]
MSSDREKRIKTLRRDLEGWREILVVIHSLLIWEKQYYPAITASVISFIYLLVWYIDPAVLTFISTVGLLAVLSDFLLPTVILLAALYPGLRRQDVVKKHFASFMQNIAKILKGSSPGNVGDQGDRPVKKD